MQQLARVIDSSFAARHRVEVYKMGKANGENAQVSFCPRLGRWIACSKNVGIAVSTREDLNLDVYSDSRYLFATRIAETWFEFLATRSAAQIEELKQILSSNTFVGELVGAAGHQHLVVYDHQHLIFYAVVPLDMTTPCVPPPAAIDIFDRLGITRVTSSLLGTVSNRAEFVDLLSRTSAEIASASIEQEEEGVVVYFVQAAEPDLPTQTLLLGKLKTLEYRLYRKLREKLSSYVLSKHTTRSKRLRMYEQESKELAQNHSMPKPLEYYFSFARAAFNFIDKYQWPERDIRDRYLDLLTAVRAEYDTLVNMTPDASPSSSSSSSRPALSFAAVAGAAASAVQPSSTSMATPASEWRVVAPPRPLIAPSDQIHCTVLIPIGIPGMGKTTMYELIRSRLAADIALHVVSSDECTNRELRRFKYDPMDKDKQKVFRRAAQEGSKTFFRTIGDILRQSNRLLRSVPKTNKMLLMFDKNHPPNALNRAISTVMQNCPAHLVVHPIAILPQTLSCAIQRQDYPLSLEFLHQCLQRVRRRVGHPTLNGTEPEYALTVVRFFKLFANQSLEDEVLRECGFKMVLRFPFTVQEDAYPFTESQRGALSRLVQITPPFEREPAPETLQEFNQLLDTVFPSSSSEVAEPAVASLAEVGNLFASSIASTFESAINIAAIEPISMRGKSSEKTTPAKRRLLYAGIDLAQHAAQVEPLLAETSNKFAQSCFVDLSVAGLYPAEGLHLTAVFWRDRTPDPTEVMYSYARSVEGSLFEAQLYKIVIVPGKVACALARTNARLEKDQIAHVTLATGGWRAAQSGHLLKALFYVNRALPEDVYAPPSAASECEQRTVQVGDETVTAFIHSLSAPLDWTGPMKMYYAESGSSPARN
eukprot:GILK01003650.1.p1 GENE.GILK01003650.1~~GILK01003650.1.p1  ORF type:complete len:1015 (+),score=171.34 GILK01003650.1:418-3045(+)